MSLALSSEQPKTTISAELYVSALADHIRKHEAAYASFVKRAPVRTAPSWTTFLTLGVISSEVALPALPKLVLQLSAHHLYFLLLKFEELGVANLGPLDHRLRSLSAPMSVPWGLPSTGRDYSDAVSLRSAFSEFSIGSGWWGSGKKRVDEAEDVRYLYSSVTKLPAVRLQPFAPPAHKAAPLAKAVADFEDCPPDLTAIPLYAFKNLQSLALERLDPRGFVGWDVLASQLRSLEISQSGIEDLGELICDAVVDDLRRRTADAAGGEEEVQDERRERRRTATGASTPTIDEQSAPPPTSDDPSPAGHAHSSSASESSYPVPPRSAWHQLRHLSLTNNSLTFIPSTPLTHLAALTSLDLSSNLLIAVPSGLAHLSSLKFLNLSDNMIESLAGIAKSVGNVSAINLSRNRLENLSGLDRLFALERVDLRENDIKEALELSRLAQLPLIKEVYIERNPFSRPTAEGGEEAYRVKCFGYFAKEGKVDVKLDGTEPGLSERRGLDAQNGRSSPAGGFFNGVRRASFGANSHRAQQEEALYAGQAKVVGRRVVTDPSRRSRQLSANDSVPPVPPLPGSANAPGSTKPAPNDSDSGAEPLTSPSNASPNKPKRRKPRRIVDLDGNGNGNGLSQTTDSDPTDTLRVDTAHAHFTTSPQPASPTEAGGSGFSLAGKASRRAASQSDGALLSSAASAGAGERSGEAFRRKIEALREEVGESWLSVLGEREERVAAERSKSQSEGESGSDQTKQNQRKLTAVAAAQPADAEPVAEEDEGGRAGEAEGEAAAEGAAVAVQVVAAKKKGKKKKKKSTNGGEA